MGPRPSPNGVSRRGEERSSAGSLPAPTQALEAHRPVMASEWPGVGKGCPVELQTAVTMENLPSPPQQLPACLHAQQRNCSPGCRPPCQTASLTHTQRVLQTWPQGGTAGARLAKATSCSSGVGKGRGREEGSSGAQADGAGSALEDPRALPCSRRNRPERVGAAPGHTAGKRLTPQSLPLCPGTGDRSVLPVLGLPWTYPPGSRAMLKHDTPSQDTGYCHLRAGDQAQPWAARSL